MIHISLWWTYRRKWFDGRKLRELGQGDLTRTKYNILCLRRDDGFAESERATPIIVIFVCRISLAGLGDYEQWRAMVVTPVGTVWQCTGKSGRHFLISQSLFCLIPRDRRTFVSGYRKKGDAYLQTCPIARCDMKGLKNDWSLKKIQLGSAKYARTVTKGIWKTELYSHLRIGLIRRTNTATRPEDALILFAIGWKASVSLWYD
jgi:hypothetical protein